MNLSVPWKKYFLERTFCEKEEIDKIKGTMPQEVSKALHVRTTNGTGIFQEIAKGVIFCFNKHKENWINLYYDRFIP